MAANEIFEIALTNFVELGSFSPILGITKVLCALFCLRKYDCSSFFYHADQMSCVPSMTRHFNTTLLQSQNGYNYYMRRQDCTDEWEVFNGRCYFYDYEIKSHDQARAKCLEKGAYLAQTDSDFEDDFFKFLSKQRGTFWIGGEKENGTWFWQDGNPLSSYYWAKGEPRGEGLCLSQWRQGNGHDDNFCHYRKRSLCEK